MPHREVRWRELRHNIIVESIAEVDLQTREFILTSPNEGACRIGSRRASRPTSAWSFGPHRFLVDFELTYKKGEGGPARTALSIDFSPGTMRRAVRPPTCSLSSARSTEQVWLEEVIMATYQAAGGAGAEGMAEHGLEAYFRRTAKEKMNLFCFGRKCSGFLTT